MMKKGASHVDWAISMGLFLVFVMITLIFLRPGTEPTYKGDVLIKIVEEGLNENGTFLLEKGFLVIEPQGIANGEYRIRIRNPIDAGLNTHWKINQKHLGLVNSSLGKVPSSELLYTDYDLTDEYCDVNPGVCLDDVLDIKTYLINNKKNVFWFVYSEHVSYTIHDPVVIKQETCPEEGCFADGGCLLDGENFTYNFGVIEKQTGFSPSKLDVLNQITDDPEDQEDEYDKLKREWGIPEDKDFKITIQQV